MRRGPGLSADRLAGEYGGQLRTCKLVAELIGEQAANEVRGKALYGLIHWLLGRGLSIHTEQRSLEAYLCLANALNVDPTLDWDGASDCVLFPKPVVKNESEREWNSVIRRRDSPKELGLDRSIAFGVHDVASSTNEDWEAGAWGEIVAELLDGGLELPKNLVDWAEHAKGRPEPERSVLLNIPHPIQTLYGREHELLEAQNILKDGRPALLAGAPGIGKTQLAAQIIDIHRRSGVERIAFIQSSLNPDSQFAQFGRLLGATTPDLPLVVQTSATTEYLTTSRKPWLLIFDDIEDGRVYHRLAPHNPDHGSILLTSKNPKVLATSVSVVSIGKLPLGGAALLLRTDAGLPDDPDAERLADKMSCIPLALSQAAAYCSLGTPFGTYLQLIESLGLPQLSEQSWLYSDYDETLLRTVLLSLQKASTTSNHALELFIVASYLHGSNIHAEWFSHHIDPLDIEVALSSLARLSLVDRQGDRFQIHGALQLLTREFAIIGLKASTRSRLSQLALKCAIGERTKGVLREADILKEHNLNVIHWAEVAPLDIYQDERALVRPVVGYALNYSASASTARSPMAREVARRAVGVADRWYGQREVQYAEAVMRRAMVDGSDLSVDGVGIASEAAALVDKFHSNNPRLLRLAKWTLGSALLVRQRDLQAYNMLWEAFEMPLNQDELAADLIGLRRLVIEACVRVGRIDRVQEAREIFVDRYPNILPSVDQPQIARPDAGDDNQDVRVDVTRERLSMQRTEHGEYDPETMSTMDVLAEACCAADRHDEAVQLGTELLALTLRKFGESGIEVYKASLRLAGWLLSAERFEECGLLLDRLLQSFEASTYVDVDYLYGNVQLNLANMLLLSEPGPDSVEKVQAMLDRARHLYDPEDEWVLCFSSILARMYERSRRPSRRYRFSLKRRDRTARPGVI